MAIRDSKLNEWSKRGDHIYAYHSYHAVKEVLTPDKLNDMPCAVYAQGSYANKTNIPDDSDVDMVVALQSAFYPHKGRLSPPELAEYEEYYKRADITWHAFREVVHRALRHSFFIAPGSKCIKVRSSLMRLSADVLIALDYRYYLRFPSFEGQQFVDGVQFYTSSGDEVVNYPKRHIDACTLKQGRTSDRYRPVVRIAKKARNALIADEDSPIVKETAPSYFLESLLWNVPDGRYAENSAQAYRNSIDWLYAHSNLGQLAELKFPNGMGKLFRDTPDTAWSKEKAQSVIYALHHQMHS